MTRNRNNPPVGPAASDVVKDDMTLDLFESNEAYLAEVSARIAPLVCAFLRSRLGAEPEFHADELRQYVASHGITAPASADRVMRDLRRRGAIGYEVVSRKRSLYRVTAVA